VICGLSGNDRILARGGNDVVAGGRGADRILGGKGDGRFNRRERPRQPGAGTLERHTSTV
jgi:Ca2+-binding RTX toxin-like protein